MHGDEDTDAQAFDASHLDIEFDLPRPVDEMLFPDIYVGLDIPLLAPGDGIVTDRHHASADRYEADDPQNQIGGQISSFTLSGWLRHGCERVVQAAGATACHPGAANADFSRADVYERDLDAGYHEKGTCAEDTEGDRGCVIYDLFGGFGDRPGNLLRRPVRFSPIRRQVDVTSGEVEAHYRRVSTQVRSRNDADAGQPLRHAERHVVGNVKGTWLLTLRTLKPEFVGLLLEAVAYLDAHSDEFDFQLGGARNFGAGMVDAEVLNPLYDESDIRRVYDRAKQPSKRMDRKDDLWVQECRDEFVHALQERIRQDSDNPDAVVGSPPDASDANDGDGGEA